MRIFKYCLACMLGLALGAAASAQVYQSKDAQGNTVFSDMPSAGAEVVKVPPTNSADPVADAPERPQPAAAPAKPRANGATNPGQRAVGEDDDDDEYPYYYGGADVDSEEAQERREEARERREEGAVRPDGERQPRVETLPAAPRRPPGGVRR